MCGSARPARSVRREQVTELGPKARRRKRWARIRLAWWLVNIPLAVGLTFMVGEQVLLPYLVAISVFANVEAALAAIGAESPLDE